MNVLNFILCILQFPQTCKLGRKLKFCFFEATITFHVNFLVILDSHFNGRLKLGTRLQKYTASEILIIITQLLKNSIEKLRFRIPKYSNKELIYEQEVKLDKLVT